MHRQTHDPNRGRIQNRYEVLERCLAVVNYHRDNIDALEDNLQYIKDMFLEAELPVVPIEFNMGSLSGMKEVLEDTLKKCPTREIN